MKDLKERLREAVAFDEGQARKYLDHPAFAETDPEELVNGALREHTRLMPILSRLIDVAVIGEQGIDGKTRLVVPGDTWHERMKNALAALEKELGK